MLYLLQDVQHSEIYTIAVIISVVSSDSDFGCLLLSEPQVCAYVCVFIEQRGIIS